MVRHLQFLLFLASHPLSLMDHLRFRPVCCDPASLGNQGALAWNFLGVPWSPFVRFIIFVFYLEDLLPLLGALLGTLACRALVVLWRSSWAHSGRSLSHLSDSLLLGSILCNGIYQLPCKPSGTCSYNPPLYRVCFLGLFVDFSWRTAWPTQGACRNQKDWLSCLRYSFQSSYRIRRSDVLLNSRTYSIWLAYVSGPVIDWHWWRRRDEVLVLNIKISHPSYLMFYWLVI